MIQSNALVQVETRENIVWATIRRSKDRNSINSLLMAEILQVLENAEKTNARAIVFSGEGDTYFIGGADALEMIRCTPEQAYGFSMRIQRLFDRMEESPLLIMAAINGLCYGGGLEFALACDFRIAAETARMGLPEVRVGIIPGGGGTQRLPMLVGKGKALEIILSGRLYSAEQALAMGLVHEVAPGADLFSRTAGLLEPIFRNPQYALSNAKRALQAFQNFGFADGLAVERNQFKSCFKHDFFEKEIQRQVKAGIMPTTETLPLIQ